MADLVEKLWPEHIPDFAYPKPGAFYAARALKDLGLRQNLTRGDWYYVNLATETEQEEAYELRVYTRLPEEELTYEDMSFMGDGRYVRVPSATECIGILMYSGFSLNNGIQFSPDRVTICVTQPDLGEGVSLVAHGDDFNMAMLNVTVLAMNQLCFSAKLSEQIKDHGLIAPAKDKKD